MKVLKLLLPAAIAIACCCMLAWSMQAGELIDRQLTEQDCTQLGGCG